MLVTVVPNERSLGLARESAWPIAALLPAALTLYLGFQSGGFYPGATSLAAAEVAVVVALWFALARRPLAGVGLPVALAAAGLGCFAAWTLLSSGWSESPARALPEYTRALLYLFAFVLFGMLPFDRRRVRRMLYGVAAAIVAICAAGIVARTLPNVILDSALVEKDRLAYPLTYWNTLGILAGIGIVLCGHLACSIRDHWSARILGSAAVPLLSLTLLYTLSRGATGVTLAAVVIYVLVGRPRGLLTGAIATFPTTLIVLAVANPPNALTAGDPTGPVAVAAGQHVALVLVACMLGAAALRAGLLPLDRWLAALSLPDRARRPVRSGVVVAATLLALVGFMAFDGPELAQTKYGEFTERDNTLIGGGSSRLLNANTNGRREHWDVALEAFRNDRLKGSGAGTYALLWPRERAGSVHVQDAHSLYLEVLGELGLVGLTLLGIPLLLILGGFAFRARGPDRALFAALLAAGLAWAVHAGGDWDWEMPVVTLWFFALGGAALARTPGRPGRTRRAMPVVRALGVAGCLALAVLPARMAISEARLNVAIDAVRTGDCLEARSAAREALSAVEQRASPYQAIAFCEMRGGRYRSAVLAMTQAIERDPHNWEMHYGLSMARAAAGLDPRRAARKAARLNPNDELASAAPARFRGKSRREWRVAGRNAPLLPPSRGGR